MNNHIRPIGWRRGIASGALGLVLVLCTFASATARAQSSPAGPCIPNSNRPPTEFDQAANSGREAIFASLREKLSQLQSTDSADLDYATLMQAYDDALTKMAQDELAHGRDAEIKLLAKRSLNEQEKRRDQFKVWVEKFHQYD